MASESKKLGPDRIDLHVNPTPVKYKIVNGKETHPCSKEKGAPTCYPEKIGTKDHNRTIAGSCE